MLILGGIGMPFPEDATFILCGFLYDAYVIGYLVIKHIRGKRIKVNK